MSGRNLLVGIHHTHCFGLCIRCRRLYCCADYDECRLTILGYRNSALDPENSLKVGMSYNLSSSYLCVGLRDDEMQASGYIYMTDTHQSYKASNRLQDIIDSDTRMLRILSCFNIPFGTGGSTIAEICDVNDIDRATFLAVSNIVTGREIDSDAEVSLPTLLAYLRRSHSFISDFMLPEIKELLIRGLHQPEMNDAALMVLRFFDEYMTEVHSHIQYEENRIFGYVESLVAGMLAQGVNIQDFASKHGNMTSKLRELKNLFVQHCRMPNTPVLSRALADIYVCGHDMERHCEVEDKLLIPAAERLEMQLHDCAKECVAPECVDCYASLQDEDDPLSPRERDIVRLVSCGLSNKEIADRLCLSFHTVTTYRRNLSSKLNIHSSAGLTIYAILHHIIDLKDVETAQG